MANTRRPAPTPDAAARLAIDEAVASTWARRLSSLRDARIAVGYSGGRDSSVLRDARIAVGYSGGRDSSVLLDALVRAFGAERLVAVHVHHGLHAHADAWAAHAQAQARAISVACVVRQVNVEAHGQGIEAAARDARYAALFDACAEAACQVLALAHHRDDQAETVLLQLMRGAGLAGLAAMPVWRDGPACAVWRPLLDVPRATIDQAARDAGIAYVDDPSNDDERYARNAVRARALPLLETLRAGATRGLARSAAHLQEAIALADEVARADLDAARERGGLSIARLAALSPARRSNALRHWIADEAGTSIDATRFREFERQLLSAGPTSTPSLDLGDVRVVASRGLLGCVMTRPSSDPPPVTWSWQGQGDWVLPAWRGAFTFETNALAGVDAALLRAAPLIARARTGGETFASAPQGLARSLKHGYQQADVPRWVRDSAPLLFCAEQLVWAPGLGVDARVRAADGQGIGIAWRPDRKGARGAPV